MEHEITIQELLDMLQQIEDIKAKIVGDMIVNQHTAYSSLEMALVYAIQELVKKLFNRGYTVKCIQDVWQVTRMEVE